MSSRVIIREWESQDFGVYKSWHDGDFPWIAYNGPYYPRKSLQDIDQEIIQLRMSTKDKVRSRMVITDVASQKLIGTVSWYWQSEETQWMSVGIAIYNDKCWGRGLGAEALRQWCTLLFDRYEEIVRLDLRTWSGNTGMMKLAEKIGFTLEARFRNARVVDDKYYDSLGYGVLRSEWED